MLVTENHLISGHTHCSETAEDEELDYPVEPLAERVAPLRLLFDEPLIEGVHALAEVRREVVDRCGDGGEARRHALFEPRDALVDLLDALLQLAVL